MYIIKEKKKKENYARIFISILANLITFFVFTNKRVNIIFGIPYRTKVWSEISYKW